MWYSLTTFRDSTSDSVKRGRRLCIVSRFANQALLPEVCSRAPLLRQTLPHRGLAFRCSKHLLFPLVSSEIKTLRWLMHNDNKQHECSRLYRNKSSGVLLPDLLPERLRGSEGKFTCSTIRIRQFPITPNVLGLSIYPFNQAYHDEAF